MTNHSIDDPREHLTESDLRNLLEGDPDAQFLDRVSEHLDVCPDCQSRLEHHASSPNQWRRFAEVIEEAMGDRDTQADSARKSQTKPSSVAVIVVAVIVLVGGMTYAVIYASELLADWRHSSPSPPPTVPTVPEPEKPPFAPVPETPPKPSAR